MDRARFAGASAHSVLVGRSWLRRSSTSLAIGGFNACYRLDSTRTERSLMLRAGTLSQRHGPTLVVGIITTSLGPSQCPARLLRLHPGGRYRLIQRILFPRASSPLRHSRLADRASLCGVTLGAPSPVPDPRRETKWRTRAARATTGKRKFAGVQATTNTAGCPAPKIQEGFAAILRIVVVVVVD